MEYFKNEFDFSELDKNHQLYDTTNKKGIGNMKKEASPIIELDKFIALRSKSHAYSYAGAPKNQTKKVYKNLPRWKVILSRYLIIKQQLQLIVLSDQKIII